MTESRTRKCIYVLFCFILFYLLIFCFNKAFKKNTFWTRTIASVGVFFLFFFFVGSEDMTSSRLTAWQVTDMRKNKCWSIIQHLRSLAATAVLRLWIRCPKWLTVGGCMRERGRDFLLHFCIWQATMGGDITVCFALTRPRQQGLCLLPKYFWDHITCTVIVQKKA